jgi:hypothetical protein
MTNRIENNAGQSKPLGIILTALYFAIVNGLLSVIVSIPLLFLSGSGMPAWISLLALVMLALGVLSIATCYGLWLLIEWGRKLAIAISAISIPLTLLSLKMPGQQTTSSVLVLVVAGLRQKSRYEIKNVLTGLVFPPILCMPYSNQTRGGSHGKRTEGTGRRKKEVIQNVISYWRFSPRDDIG